MLRSILFVLFALSLTAIQAQDVPQAFKYQSVIRDMNGDAVTNQAVGVRFYIIQDNNTVYAETHSTTSNGIGLVNLNIGRGTAESGDFSMIDWGQVTRLGIGVDITGGTNYEDLGHVELLSVPYAIHAGNGGGDDADADPANELQTLSREGSDVILSQDGGTVSVDDADADPANELQTLTQDDTNVTLSGNGGTITVNDADSDSTNELQTLTQDGTNVTLSGGGGTISVNDGDSDAANEIEMPTNAEAGDVAFFDGSNWVTVPDGQGGQMLTLNNSGTPYWSGPTTEGLLQVTDATGKIIYVHPTVNNVSLGFNPDMTVGNLANLEDIISASPASQNDFDGEGNTAFLVNLYGDGNYAAKVCQDLEAFGFDDWYLPSSGEMIQIYLNFSNDGGDGTFAGPVRYWTSSVLSAGSNLANNVTYGFNPSGNINPSNNNGKGQVLCVRK